MIAVKNFFKFLNKNNINFFSGVPDSILRETKNFLKKLDTSKHIITSNEGSAVALAIGYNLATKKIPCVYMQNSGLGNALNPLISIAHPKVYSIPILLMIGWRGSPGINDEPQHKVKGSITRDLLKLMNIKYCVLKKTNDLKKLKKLIQYAKKNNKPIACLIPKKTFENRNLETKIEKSSYKLKREDFIKILLKTINKNDKIVATTGYTSRELNQIRLKNNEKRGKDFYMVGGMGHSSMVSLGISMKTKNKVICLDGDGSFLMHLGAISSISKVSSPNYKHILFNNLTHESVGGQPTNIQYLNIEFLVKSGKYKQFFRINKKSQIKKTLKKFLNSRGPSFLEVMIDQGTINNLGRPKNLLKIKEKFMK